MWGVIVFQSNKLEKIGKEFSDLVQPKIQMFTLGIVLSASHFRHIAGLWASLKNCFAVMDPIVEHTNTITVCTYLQCYAWGRVLLSIGGVSWIFQNSPYFCLWPTLNSLSNVNHCFFGGHPIELKVTSKSFHWGFNQTFKFNKFQPAYQTRQPTVQLLRIIQLY